MFRGLFGRKTAQKPPTEAQRTESETAAPMRLEFVAPVSGTVIPLDQVDDPAFAQRMVGDGIAIEAGSDTVVSPISGTLTNLFPTGHAFGITTAEGLEILVHVGLDTVELRGAGFTPLASQGDTVEAGQPVLRLDLGVLRERARSLATPVVITNMGKVGTMDVTSAKSVRAGQDVVLTVMLKANAQ